MSTPSAPLAKASMMNCGSTRPEHISRMVRQLAAYFMRDTPARSAAVYVHQLQKNATIRGSQFLSVIGQDPFDLAVDLFVLEQVLDDRTGRAGGHAGPAALAQRLVDGRLLLLLDEG